MPPLILESPTPRAHSLSEGEIMRRIDACPKLASLQSISRALSKLLHSEGSRNSQIADIIGRDPSLSARLLRMVNTVYFGLSARVNNIEEAVFFLGLGQIRELSLATPVIEEMGQLQQKAGKDLPWKQLWTHSIAVGILAREVMGSTPLRVDDDTDYLAGLLHNVGKVVMAYAFPVELGALITSAARDPAECCRQEREQIGWDHAQIGAYYLARHQLPEPIVLAVRYHHDPEAAPSHRIFAAAVQVADHLARDVGINGGFERLSPTKPDAWLALPGWGMLHTPESGESKLARTDLVHALDRLPCMLEGLL